MKNKRFSERRSIAEAENTSCNESLLQSKESLTAVKLQPKFSQAEDRLNRERNKSKKETKPVKHVIEARTYCKADRTVITRDSDGTHYSHKQNEDLHFSEQAS